MSIIYETEQIYTGPFIPPTKLDPVKQWSKHYENYKYLKFLFDNSKDWKERREANKELQIAQKKMSRWTNMSHTITADIEKAKKEIDSKWMK